MCCGAVLYAGSVCVCFYIYIATLQRIARGLFFFTLDIFLLLLYNCALMRVLYADSVVLCLLSIQIVHSSSSSSRLYRVHCAFSCQLKAFLNRQANSTLSERSPGLLNYVIFI